MKKKLLAVVLSVVMIAALIVPMMAISADGAPTATISLGAPTKTTRVGNDGVTYDVIALDVYLSDNTEDQGFFTARYKVISEDGLACYFSDHSKPAKVDKGFDKGDYTDGDSSLNTTIGQLSEGGKNWFQVVQDSTNDFGIYADAGKLITVYFMAPEAIGTYTFTLEWMDGTDDTPVQYDMTVANGTQKYVKECTEHKWDNGVAAEGVACGSTADIVYTCENGCGATKTETGAKVEHDWVEDADAYVAPQCGVAGKKVFKCTNANCPEGTKEEPVAALEHKWDNGTADPSKVCGETADVVYTCENGCGKTKTEAGAVIEHDWKLDESKHVDPKCGVAGKDVYVCQRANCPVGEREEPIEALEHVWGDYTVTKVPTADAEGELVADCTLECGEKDVIVLKKLATEVKVGDDTYKADEAILPEDITMAPVGDVAVDGDKYTADFVFTSDIIENLEGKVTVTLEASTVKNVAITTKDAEGNVVDVEVTRDGDYVTFEADLAGEYTLTFEQVKTSPDTSDAANTVVFAVVALMAVAGLVVVGKKRFAL